MTGERLYTLVEADQALRERRCAQQGHDWQVMSVLGQDVPACVYCERCGRRWPPDGTEAAETRAVGDEMVCDRCRKRHGVVWFAPSDLWNDVMRRGDKANADDYAFCCPACFMDLAERRLRRTFSWLVTPFDDGPVDRADQIVLRRAAESDPRTET